MNFVQTRRLLMLVNIFALLVPDVPDDLLHIAGIDQAPEPPAKLFSKVQVLNTIDAIFTHYWPEMLPSVILLIWPMSAVIYDRIQPTHLLYDFTHKPVIHCVAIEYRYPVGSFAGFVNFDGKYLAPLIFPSDVTAALPQSNLKYSNIRRDV